MTIEDIFNEAKNCHRCYGETPIHVCVPDPKFGTKNVKIMFINERPGRIGAGGSGYISMDNNDPTARFFTECFQQLNMPISDIISTNACLCYPLMEGYKDKAPIAREIKNCNYFLKKQIETLNPKLIVSLGNIPLKALKYLYPESKKLQQFKLKNNIGQVIKETRPWIYPLYHNSMRVRNSYRSPVEQKKDWLKIKDILKHIDY